MGGKLIPGVNDLQTVRPDLAKQWHPFRNGELTPSDVCVYSSRKVWWQVEEVRFGKHFLLEWQALISNRAGGAGCPYTSVPPKKLMKGFNDLASVNPEVAALWHPEKNGSLSPDMVFACAQKKFWWRHTVEKDGKTYIHEWQAFPQYVRRGAVLFATESSVCRGTTICSPPRRSWPLNGTGSAIRIFRRRKLPLAPTGRSIGSVIFAAIGGRRRYITG